MSVLFHFAWAYLVEMVIEARWTIGVILFPINTMNGLVHLYIIANSVHNNFQFAIARQLKHFVKFSPGRNFLYFYGQNDNICFVYM